MFWKGVLGYLPVNVVQGLVGLATIVTFTRLLSPEQYGAYALGFSVMALVHTALFTWNEAAMARFWAAEDGRGDAHHHLATIYRVWLWLLTGLAVAVGVVAVWPMGPAVKLAVFAGLACVLPRTLAKLAQERQRAAGEVKAAAFMDIGMTAGGFAVGAGLAMAGLGGAAPLIGAGVAAALCVAFAAPREMKLASGGAFDVARAKAYAGYGAPVALSLILALVLSTTDRFLIAAFLDEAAVGAYHAGYSLSNRTLDVVFIWLGAAGGPALVMALERGGPDALRAAAKEQAGLIVLIAVPAAVGLALTAAPLADVMVGEALRTQAARVTPWIALSGLCAGVTTYYLAQAFTLAKRTGLLLGAMAIPAIANVALNLVLIPRMGLTGALAATLISYGVGMVSAWALGLRALALPIPWLTIGQAGAATAAMALVVSLLPSFGGVPELALKAAAGGLVYGVIVIALDAGHLRTCGNSLLAAVRARGAAA